eukprot:1147965-Pelagomonas_calceolata.AAC.6
MDPPTNKLNRSSSRLTHGTSNQAAFVFWREASWILIPSWACCLLLQVRWEANVQNGVCGVQFDRKDIPMNKFVVCCLEAQFHVFDARTQHPKEGFTSLSEKVNVGSTVWGSTHLPQNREIMMVSSGDGTLYLYKYHYPDQRRIKVGGPSTKPGSKGVAHSLLAAETKPAPEHHQELVLAYPVIRVNTFKRIRIASQGPWSQGLVSHFSQKFLAKPELHNVLFDRVEALLMAPTKGQRPQHVSLKMPSLTDTTVMWACPEGSVNLALNHGFG